MSGRYYVFEGLDGAGKSTLSLNVFNELQKKGEKIVQKVFPSNRRIGKFIRESFSDPNAISPVAYLHLLTADALDAEGEIKYLLDNDFTILADRHTFASSFAYQSDLHLPEGVFAACRPTLFAPPNAFFVVDIPASVALDRIKARGTKTDIYENVKLEQMEKRRNRYLALSTLLPNVVILDGTRDPFDNVKTVLNIMSAVDKIIFSRN